MRTSGYLPEEDDGEKPDLPPRSNPVGPPKLRKGPKADPIRTPKTITRTSSVGAGLHFESDETHYRGRQSTTKTITESISQTETVVYANEEVQPLPTSSVVSEITPRSTQTKIKTESRPDTARRNECDHEDHRSDNPAPLEQEQARRIKELEDELAVKNNQIQQQREELMEQQNKAEGFRVRWVTAGKELRKMSQVQSHGSQQVTDSYLIDLITRLRYNIRDLCIQYFSDLPRAGVKFQESEFHEEYMRPNIRGSDEYSYYLGLAEWRPVILEATVWRAVVGRLFPYMRWAEKTLFNLCTDLNPNIHVTPNIADTKQAEALKKFQMWKASTIGFVLTSPDTELSTKANQNLRGWKKDFVKSIDAGIGFMATDREDFKSELEGVIDQAIDLDKEICKQVAQIQWEYPKMDAGLYFDPLRMELRNGEMRDTHFKDGPALMVITPAVTKRGKSNGEGFHESSVLMRMEVLPKSL